MSFLPSAVNYQEPLAVLPPDAQNFLVAVVPSNGSTFGPGSIIQVDLGSRGFLDPASLAIRYKFNSTSPNAQQTKMVGTPAYTPFVRLETLINSTTIESINNYNTVTNMLTNLDLSVADKLGQQYALGYVGLGAATVDNQSTDGRLMVATADSGYFSAPLYGVLSGCEKLIPLFLVNNIRIQFTVDTLANMCSNIAADVAASSFTGFTISNFEVVYNCIDLGATVQSEIIQMNPKIKIKSQSYSTAISPILTGTSGSINLIYNQRFASVKSAYLNFGGTAAGLSANKNMDSFDVTAGNGDYQLNIGGVNYPQKALSTLNNKAGIFQELRRSMNSIFGSNVSMSINSSEFNMLDNVQSTYLVPGKFWVGINLQKLTIPNKAFFTGTSTQNSPITAVVNCGAATNQLYNAMLILNYDTILEIDSAT